MPTLVSQRTYQDAQAIPFCYLCGQAFRPQETKSRDHVPPKKVFHKEDRQRGPVLILPTHLACNTEWSIADERLGQLIGSLHGTKPRAERRRLRGRILAPATAGRSAFVGVYIDLARDIDRMVRGFHAALYKEHLPSSTRSAIHPPMPGFAQTSAGVVFDPILPQQPLIVKLIKMNRGEGRLDRIEAYNGQLKYHCVWIQLDNGTPTCVYALNIYDWKRLGSRRRPIRGCVGFYSPSAGMPNTATRAIGIDVPCLNAEPLDPFGH